jgi:hypothetical protein
MIIKMTTIQSKKKDNYKIVSRRIKNKLLKSKLKEILEEITNTKNSRRKLIYRQFTNFYSKKYFVISLLDTCDENNLIELCDGYHIKKDINDKKITPIYRPVVNTDVGNIIDSHLFGWYSPDHLEIVLTNNLTETKLTLIHEFSHFLYHNKFGNKESDLLDSINDEFEAFFQELLLNKKINNYTIDNSFICVENVSKIRILFETRYLHTIYDLFVSHIETEINKFCKHINIMNINLFEYMDSKPETNNNENSIFTKIKSYVYQMKLWAKHFIISSQLHKNNLNMYIEYSRNLISKFKNQELKNKLEILFNEIDNLTNTLFYNL